jgi:hypothetical protein
VNEVIGKVRAALERSHVWDRSAIVILSDHEFRRRTMPAEHTHVPLIAKRQGQVDRLDINEDARAETVVADLVRAYRIRP